ncbi:1-aminocyclopropane-1-carboxylate deaminase/D-cysteine desulfhydrase [Myroides indicus]|uniref:1-aminocyclopropane-1-carboxylate deaminase n=1 Tax=Myroides indicus TaxID=1323422 RepID=A0A4R7F691_9FLAO|nr:pyridoxal-phosphate dependent enzyme [Myroides indicus]TDS65318.1 1-aminocyclopropane-1-carboxylate deaminase [Myroides indicus]
MFDNEFVFNQKSGIDFPNDVQLYVKREDLLHAEVSGNKFRKLKYNILKAKEKGYEKLLTFGGAYSNHIAATAAAGRIFDIATVGVIRGEELLYNYMKNPTLFKAQQDGMVFEFVSREQYRYKTKDAFIDFLNHKYGDFYLIPEGGTNGEAIKGTEEILKEEDAVFDFICVPVGTGGTISGIINRSFENQCVLGFPALKGDFLFEDIRKFVNKTNWDLILDYHFGGYAKYNNELLDFINNFQTQTQIRLDPVYTGKMMYGITDLIQKGFFKKGSKILAIHTGGLQGWNDSIKLK